MIRTQWFVLRITSPPGERKTWNWFCGRHLIILGNVSGGRCRLLRSEWFFVCWKESIVHNQLARVLHLLSRGLEGRDREARLCWLRLCRTMRWIGSCRSLRDDGRKRVQSCGATVLLGAAQIRCLEGSNRLGDSDLRKPRKVGLLSALLLLLFDGSRRWLRLLESAVNIDEDVSCN